jgi:hypothetical protein
MVEMDIFVSGITAKSNQKRCRKTSDSQSIVSGKFDDKNYLEGTISLFGSAKANLYSCLFN